MPRVTLDHVVIAVSDRARSDDFYRRVLGAEIASAIDVLEKDHVASLSPDEARAVSLFRMYRFGTTQFNVHGPEMNVDPKLLARIPVAPGGSDICFEWAGSIAGAVEHLKECDVPIETGPVRSAGRRGSGTSVYFRDPDGTLLEFISYAAEALASD